MELAKNAPKSFRSILLQSTNVPRTTRVKNYENCNLCSSKRHRNVQGQNCWRLWAMKPRKWFQNILDCSTFQRSYSTEKQLTKRRCSKTFSARFARDIRWVKSQFHQTKYFKLWGPSLSPRLPLIPGLQDPYGTAYPKYFSLCGKWRRRKLNVCTYALPSYLSWRKSRIQYVCS